MIAPIARSSLFRPLDERAVLVPDETIFYAERQHWASIVQPVYETFIFLLLVVWVVEAQTVGYSPTSSLTGLILLGAAIHAALLAVSDSASPISRLAQDPFSNTPRAGTGPLFRWVTGLGLLILIATVGFRQTGVVAVVLVIGRLVIILARWSFYERRIVTNRRLIESSGFLGSRISSMPLSRVTDIVYSRTIPGEIFGYARMRVETAGQDQALGVVQFINEPDQFYEALVNFSAPAPAPPGSGDEPEI